jgi:lipoprotein NlpI
METKRDSDGADGGTSTMIEPSLFRSSKARAAMGPSDASARQRRGRVRLAVVLAALQMGGGIALTGLSWLGDSFAARAENEQRPAIDDPFAEELNPFPRDEKPKPRTGQTPRATGPKKDREKERDTEPERDLDEELTKPAPRRPAPRGEDDDMALPDRDDTPPVVRPRPTAKPMVPNADLLPFPDVDMPPPEEDSPARKLLVKADKLDRKGKYEEAKKLVLEAIEEDPKLPVARLALSIVTRHLGDFEGSLEACSAGLRLDPMDAELYLRRGIAWFHLGRHGIALEDFEDAAGIAYDDPRPELWRGLTLMELDKPLEAISAYSSAIRRDRTYDLAYLNRGLAYLVTDEPSKAEFDFDQAIRHDPRDARAWFNRGVAQARQSEYADAADSYGESLRIDPKMEGARRNLEAIRGRIGLAGRRRDERARVAAPAAELVPAGRPLPPRSAGNG